MKRIASRAWRPPVRVGVLIGIWELYVDLGGADSLILPPPHQIATSLYDDRSLLWSSFLVTAREVLLGIAVAIFQLYIDVANGAYVALLALSILTPAMDRWFEAKPLV